MTSERFEVCRKAIGWSYRGLADRLGIHETRVRRWASGKLEIPQTVEGWLERLYRVHADHLLPAGWDLYKTTEGRGKRIRVDKAAAD